MAEWHRAYKGLPPVRKMMVATIIWLYRGEPDKTWLARLPSTWHAADAIAALLEAGALRDWGRLVALYPVGKAAPADLFLTGPRTGRNGIGHDRWCRVCPLRAG